MSPIYPYFVILALAAGIHSSKLSEQLRLHFNRQVCAMDPGSKSTTVRGDVWAWQGLQPLPAEWRTGSAFRPVYVS